MGSQTLALTQNFKFHQVFFANRLDDTALNHGGLSTAIHNRREIEVVGERTKKSFDLSRGNAVSYRLRQSIGIGAERKESLVKCCFRHRNLICLFEFFGVEVQNQRRVYKADLQQIVCHGAGGRISGRFAGICQRGGPHACANRQARTNKRGVFRIHGEERGIVGWFGKSHAGALGSL